VGLTKVKVLVVNPDSGANAEVELIVDTGSIFTWIDGRVLEGIGVRPRRVRSFRTIDGRVVSRRVGVAVIRYGSTRVMSRLYLLRMAMPRYSG
jgi:hypothetical protein